MLNSIKCFLHKNNTTILIGLGVAGFISSTIAATKETPKAMKMREAFGEDKTFKDEAKIIAKCYWPVILGCVVSAGCIIFAHTTNLKKNAAIVAAYTISETRLLDYKKAMNKVLGPKDQEKIKDEVAKDILKAAPKEYDGQIIPSNGEYLCYDSISGRYFKSNIERIRKAVNDINSQLVNQNFAYLNEFYYLIGLDRIELGDKLGWSMATLGETLEVDFSSQLTNGGEPCLVIVYDCKPAYIDFD